MTALLGYIPFLQPLPLDAWWLILILPLTLAISVVYKTIKLDDLNQLPKQAVILWGQIVVFMVLAATGLWLLTEVV